MEENGAGGYSTAARNTRKNPAPKERAARGSDSIVFFNSARDFRCAGGLFFLHKATTDEGCFGEDAVRSNISTQ
jgi:hypothetical protein